MDDRPAVPPENLRLRLDEPLIAPLIPTGSRETVLLLWSLDARLAELARTGREPALRQIRLRWWIEQLSGLGNQAIPAEPLLARIRAGLPEIIVAGELATLAEGWEAEAIGEPDDGERGALLFGLTSRVLGAPAAADAGRLWAQVERAVAAGAGDWEQLRAIASRPVARQPRPLAALTALGRTIALRCGARSRWREQAAILRGGMLRR